MPSPLDKSKIKDWKRKISNSLKGRRCCMRTEFAKGHTSWNKGTKGLTKRNKTSFKKGDIPKNYMGGLRATERDGIEIKIGTYYHPNGTATIKYESLARHNWKKKFGEIPKGMIICHKDKDILNNNIDNLELISRSELLKRNLKTYKKICVICGLEFETTNNHHKTCSKICNKEYSNILSREYSKKHKKNKKNNNQNI